MLGEEVFKYEFWDIPLVIFSYWWIVKLVFSKDILRTLYSTILAEF
jgi:hypothetical protein